jgi:hypothetical protein
MQAQETLLGCLQCLESENREEGLAPKLLDASLSLWGQKYAENLLKPAKTCKKQQVFLAGNY